MEKVLNCVLITLKCHVNNLIKRNQTMTLVIPLLFSHQLHTSKHIKTHILNKNSTFIGFTLCNYLWHGQGWNSIMGIMIARFLKLDNILNVDIEIMQSATVITLIYKSYFSQICDFNIVKLNYQQFCIKDYFLELKMNIEIKISFKTPIIFN